MEEIIKIGLGISAGKKLDFQIEHFKREKRFTIGDIDITPYLMDHSSPEAFGFLGTNRGTIAIDRGATILTRPSQPVSIFGADVLINGGTVVSQGGDIRVVAIGQSQREIGLAGVLPTHNAYWVAPTPVSQTNVTEALVKVVWIRSISSSMGYEVGVQFIDMPTKAADYLVERRKISS